MAHCVVGRTPPPSCFARRCFCAEHQYSPIARRHWASPALVFGILVALLATCAGEAGAQREPDSPILTRAVTLTGELNFADSLKALPRAGGISIVADGEPVKKTADVTFAGPLREALNRVAGAFDYKWTLSKAGVVLMTKRFRDPKELPQVLLPEMRQMAKDMVKAFGTIRFDPEEGHWDYMLRQVAGSFSQAQAAALNRGDRLPYTDMTGPQRDIVEQAILTRALGGAATRCKRLESQLAGLSRSRLRFEELPPDPTRPSPDRHINILHAAGGDPDPVVTFVTVRAVPKKETDK